MTETVDAVTETVSEAVDAETVAADTEAEEQYLQT